MKATTKVLGCMATLLVLVGCSGNTETTETVIGNGKAKMEGNCELVHAEFIIRQEWVQDNVLISIKQENNDKDINCQYYWKQDDLQGMQGKIEINYYFVEKDVQETYDKHFSLRQKGFDGTANFDYEAVETAGEEAVWFGSQRMIMIRTKENVFSVAISGPLTKQEQYLTAQAVANNIILKVK